MARGMSPTSSRKRVPPLARSNLPRRCLVAPVKAPASWPNISLSMSSLGTAAQFIFSSGPLARLLARWMARATSSLPVPRSPVMKTVAVAFAARPICSRRSTMERLSPMSSPTWPACLRRALASASARTRRMMLSSTRSRRSVERGFSRKSLAPRRVARTAASMVAWPLIMTTGRSLPAVRMRWSRPTPSPSGSETSKRAMS